MSSFRFLIPAMTCFIGFAQASLASTVYHCKYGNTSDKNAQNSYQGQFSVGSYKNSTEVILSNEEQLILKAEYQGKKINFELFIQDITEDETLYLSSVDDGAEDLSFSYKYRDRFYHVKCEKTQYNYISGGGCYI